MFQPRLECGGVWLEVFLNSSMTVFASTTDSNGSTASTSSPTREPNDPTKGVLAG
jgi:hypothetical protein